ncbi:MAG: DUF5668 domain-containing protein [Acidobacteriota bacterium]|jgi:hypothetical protein|nr:DUF5668 domain-containing protein [Acidobacteriota bacterium]
MNPVNASQLIQAVRGPILLITVGVLVAISQAGYYSFGHTWPVLLIVFGLFKLLEKAMAPPLSGPYAGQPPANPPSGGTAI